MRGELGHSRRVDLRHLLSLIGDQTVGDLINQAKATFRVGERVVQQSLADLAWDGFITRLSTGRRARSSDTILVTEKGNQALIDGRVADDLISLPKRHRGHRAALRDSGHPDRAEAVLLDWRRGIGSMSCSVSVQRSADFRESPCPTVAEVSPR